MSKKHKILIAEDDKPLVMALELKLSHAGFDVKVAMNGEEALSYIKKEDFDLVLLDLVMPKMDGFQVLETLAKEKKKHRIVVTSNLSQEEDAQKAKSLGAEDYFVKSNTEISNLVEYVKKLLSQKK